MKKYFSVVVMCLSLFGEAQVDPSRLSALQWRMIGPFRGGRTVGAVGVPRQPNVFYIGVNNGGVWKTNDYGRTWKPIFDDQPTGSIGDVAVSLSNPEVVYVGSGEGVQRPDLSVGNGMYKSINGGRTWVHLGLDNVQQIGGLAIDPRNENRVFVAALGHPYGPNTERGIYRTTDGGKTFEKILYLDENTGAIQVTMDPVNADIIYADLWAGRPGPWENGQWNGNKSGLYKSVDGGNTWKKLTNGLPTPEQGLSRIGFCIAPSDPKRLYATVEAGKSGGIYRSDDAGESWTNVNPDERFWGRGDDFAEVKVDPLDADIVYTADVVVWRSTDAGKTFTAFKGAPGGDDYHRIWINPGDHNIMLIASDQGGIVTVNGGQTFSSWYNQPTAQMYHVSADNAFPYNLYSGQQESGSVGISSRSNDGSITFHDWHPVGAQEYGYVTADPLDPDIIYGGKLSRYNKRTGQTQDIQPEVVRSGKYRFIRTAPVVFSPIDKKTIYYAGNVLFKTLDKGNSWKVISPDLSRATWDIPASVGIYNTNQLKTMPRRGVIYTVSPSPININTIWCGTDDGLIWVTQDGGISWLNRTPKDVTSWSKVSIIDAGHFDISTAYAAVNRIRDDDMHPHIYKTHDGGKTWKEIVNGLPNDPINVVREDPIRKGLLYAGSERMVYVSFDDGDHWQSLRLNMPATSIRDLVIKDDDIAIGTHGRGFWILDDITLLRQLTPTNNDELFKPSNGYRVRWSMWTDTPLPPDEPAALNPPDGEIFDYFLKDSVSRITLTVRDEKNNIVRTFWNTDTLYTIPPVNIPLYWIRPQQILSAGAGAHRFVWDMHYTPLNQPPSYPIGAVYMNTAPSSTSPWVMPGNYTAILNVNAHQYTQYFKVLMDPRVKTSINDLKLQHDLSLESYKKKLEIEKIIRELGAMKQRIMERLPDATGPGITCLNECQRLVTELEFTPVNSKSVDFRKLSGAYTALLGNLQEADLAPTSQVRVAYDEANNNFKELLKKLETVRGKIKSCL